MALLRLKPHSTKQKLIVPATPNTNKMPIWACRPKCDEYTKLTAAAIDYTDRCVHALSPSAAEHAKRKKKKKSGKKLNVNSVVSNRFSNMKMVTPFKIFSTMAGMEMSAFECTYELRMCQK